MSFPGLFQHLESIWENPSSAVLLAPPLPQESKSPFTWSLLCRPPDKGSCSREAENGQGWRWWNLICCEGNGPALYLQNLQVTSQLRFEMCVRDHALGEGCTLPSRDQRESGLALPHLLGLPPPSALGLSVTTLQKRDFSSGGCRPRQVLGSCPALPRLACLQESRPGGKRNPSG